MSRFSHARLLVIGLGLIGGSFAKAARVLPGVECVTGYDLNREECELALALDVVDEIASELEGAVRAADLIVLAVPVKAIERVLLTVKPWLNPAAIITDVGSTKANIVSAAQGIWSKPPPGFIPGHPIAGAERSGVSASDAQLFRHRKVILTPLETSDPEAVMLLARLWQRIGAEVLQMDPQRHDQVLAATSHLPHLLAFSLVDTLAAEAKSEDIFRYAAGGFRDFTRIAASDPTMWHDVCLANKDPILQQIDQFSSGVAQLRDAIAQGDSQKLIGIFTRAKSSREHFSRILERAGYAQQSDQAADQVSVQPAESLQGHLRVAGDRSISHRAIMLAAIAEGVTDIEGVVESEDSLATIQIFRDLGVVIEGPYQGRLRIYGVGLNGLQRPSAPLYFGNSATSLKILTGLLSAQAFDSEVRAGDQLSKRSFEELLEPLRAMGGKIDDCNGGLPFRITGSVQLKAIHYSPQHSSAQIKAALMLAALCSGVGLDIYENNTTRDHTERLLSDFGVRLEREGRALKLYPVDKLVAQPVKIPADLSLASAFALAATLVPGSKLIIEQTGVNPTRQHLLRLLTRMGARIDQIAIDETNHEPIADLKVESSQLHAIDCTSTELSVLGDDLPLLLVALLFAEGTSELNGIDRLPAPQHALFQQSLTQLAKVHAGVTQQGNQVRIDGDKRSKLDLRDGAIELDGRGHPMLGLALIILGSLSHSSIRVRGCRALSRVFPEYLEQGRRIGLKITKEF